MVLVCKNMRCFSPIWLPDRKLSVPCGRCAACRSRESLDWSTRLMIEDKSSACSWFVSLSLSDYFLHFINKDNFEVKQLKDLTDWDSDAWVNTLSKDYLKRFLDRFRHRERFKDSPPKWFAIGEYGSKSSREHYHVIFFFRQPVDFDVINYELTYAWMQDGYSIGNITVAPVIPERIYYITGYVIEKVDPVLPDPACQPTFRLVSNGIGKDYIKINKRFHGHDPKRRYVTLDGGAKVHMPRYYSDKLYNKLDNEIYQAYIRNRDGPDARADDPSYARRLFSDMRTYQKNHVDKIKSNRSKL